MQVYSYFEADMQPQLRTTLEDLEQLLTADAAQRQQESQQVQILDTRSAAQYNAEVCCILLAVYNVEYADLLPNMSIVAGR